MDSKLFKMLMKIRRNAKLIRDINSQIPYIHLSLTYLTHPYLILLFYHILTSSIIICITIPHQRYFGRNTCIMLEMFQTCDRIKFSIQHTIFY